MKICDLKTGMLVLLKDGTVGKVLKDTEWGNIILDEGGDWIVVDSYYEDMTDYVDEDYVGLEEVYGMSFIIGEFDIMRVYVPKTIRDMFSFNVDDHDLLWKRPIKACE